MKTLKVAQVLDTYSDFIPGTSNTPPVPVYVYQVEKVTNSIVPNISERLTAHELDSYCESEDWEVTIT